MPPSAGRGPGPENLYRAVRRKGGKVLKNSPLKGGKVLKNLTSEGGKVLKKSSGKGPYVLRTDMDQFPSGGWIAFRSGTPSFGTKRLNSNKLIREQSVNNFFLNTRSQSE